MYTSVMYSSETVKSIHTLGSATYCIIVCRCSACKDEPIEAIWLHILSLFNFDIHHILFMNVPILGQ